jgi:hypothetical protein
VSIRRDTVRELFRCALAADRPFTALSDTVEQLLREGGDRATVIEELKQFRLDELIDPEHEEQHDIVCDVLDRFYGWVAPAHRL